MGEGVKEGASVFDIVGAMFCVFREVEVKGMFAVYSYSFSRHPTYMLKVHIN